jgi:hypothetical protein
MKKLRVLAIFVVITGFWLANTTNAKAPQPIANEIVTTTTQVETTTTTTTTLPESQNPECAKWLGLGLQVGFSTDLLPMLERVLWKESRCQPEVHNATDPNGGSYGLTQINGFWCLPSRYYPNGYLQDLGILEICTDLYDPLVNLRSALVVYQYKSNWSQWGL